MFQNNENSFLTQLRVYAVALLPILKRPLVFVTLGVVISLLVVTTAIGQVRPHKRSSIGPVGALSASGGATDLSGDQFAYVDGATTITKAADDGSSDETGVNSAGDSYTDDVTDPSTDTTGDSYTDDASNGDNYYDVIDNGSDFYTADATTSTSTHTTTPSSTQSAAADAITVATYNILDIDAHAGDSNNVGGCHGGGDPGCLHTRTDRQARIITGKAGNAAFDVVGTQETSPQQWRALKNQLGSYDVFPTNTSGLSNSNDGKVAVWWNAKKFTKVDSGKAPGQSNISRNIDNPWVELRSKATGRKFYVMSIHYANSTYGGSASQIRKSSAQTMTWVRNKVSHNTPVFVVGDFNDDLRQNLSYCVFTAGGIMQNTIDMARGYNPNRQCPSNQNNGIDQVYASPSGGVRASGWTHLPNSGIYKAASDHRPVYVHMQLKY